MAHVAPLAQRIRAWWLKIEDDFQAIQDDQGDISDAAGAYDVVSLDEACRALKRDVVALETDPPSPDAALRRYLVRSLDAYSTAASECINGDYGASAGSLNTGTKWIKRATERVKELL